MNLEKAKRGPVIRTSFHFQIKKRFADMAKRF